jgi:hypothetical protein
MFNIQSKKLKNLETEIISLIESNAPKREVDSAYEEYNSFFYKHIGLRTYANHQKVSNLLGRVRDYKPCKMN